MNTKDKTDVLMQILRGAHGIVNLRAEELHENLYILSFYFTRTNEYNTGFGCTAGMLDTELWSFDGEREFQIFIDGNNFRWYQAPDLPESWRDMCSAKGLFDIQSFEECLVTLIGLLQDPADGPWKEIYVLGETPGTNMIEVPKGVESVNFVYKE